MESAQWTGVEPFMWKSNTQYNLKVLHCPCIITLFIMIQPNALISFSVPN
jgi:hypothetical protein